MPKGRVRQNPYFEVKWPTHVSDERQDVGLRRRFYAIIIAIAADGGRHR